MSGRDDFVAKLRELASKGTLSLTADATVELIEPNRPDPRLVARAQGAPLGGIAVYGLGRV